MRRRLVLLGLVGCGFDGPPELGGTPIDAPETMPSSCTVAPGELETPASDNLGEHPSPPGPFMHGGMKPPIVCMPGELPVELGVYTTAIAVDEGGNERVVRSLTVVCGTLAFTPTLHTTVGETIQTPYGGCSPAWGMDPNPPVTIAPPEPCPSGQVAVGLTGNGGTDSLFNTVAIKCAPFAASGTIGAADSSVPVTDSGSYTNKQQQAVCPENTAIVSFTWRGDCGVDELTPVCAALSCR